MLNKKIVFFDIDGTIYDYRRGIPKDIPTAISKLRENGILCSICTGRTKVMVFDEIYNMGFDALIAGGGTYVEYMDEVYIDINLNPRDVDEVVEAMREFGFIPVPEGTKNIYFDMDTKDIEQDKFINLYREKIPEGVLHIEKGKVVANKVSGRFTRKSNEKGIREKLSHKFTVINHNNSLLELIPKGISKATGIEILIEKLGIQKENTYAFGDSFNDFEMLKYVKHGIAVGNADPKLKKHIKRHTKDIFEEGITLGLKELGLI